MRWPSIAAVPVFYAAVRALLGARVGVLAALGLAASPLASAFSDYARGFALSTFGWDRAGRLKSGERFCNRLTPLAESAAHPLRRLQNELG
jgi:hypothetical protein